MSGVSSTETQVRSCAKISSSVLKTAMVYTAENLAHCYRHRGPNQPIWTGFFVLF